MQKKRATNREKDVAYKKNNPTVFSFGHRIGSSGEGAVVIDFLDSTDTHSIIASVALLKDQAIHLAEGIINTFENNDEDLDEQDE